MGTFDQISDTAAGYLWMVAYRTYTSRADRLGHARSFREPAVPAASAKAARDLLRLYIISEDEAVPGATFTHGHKSIIEAMYARWKREAQRVASEDDSPVFFGRLMAGEATGGLKQALFESLFLVPTFEVEYDGNELTWEGSEESRNPRERERERSELQEGMFQHEQMQDYSTGSRWHGRTIAETPAERAAYAKIGHHAGGRLKRKLNTSIEEDLGINPTDRIYDIDFYYDFEWQSAGGGIPADSKEEAVAEFKKRAAAINWKFPSGTKFRATRRNPEEDLGINPSQFTAKGERMYEEIKAGYEEQGEPRAKEIAARTVWARSKEIPGLVHVGLGRPPGVPNTHKKVRAR